MTGKSIRILGVALLFLGALVVLQPAALADPVTMTLTDATSQGVTPWVASIRARTSSSRSMAVPSRSRTRICDDFTTDIIPGTHGLQLSIHASPISTPASVATLRFGRRRNESFTICSVMSLRRTGCICGNPVGDQLYSLRGRGSYGESRVRNFLRHLADLRPDSYRDTRDDTRE